MQGVGQLACLNALAVTPAQAGVQSCWGPARAGMTGKMERGGFVYIMASRRNGTIYLGVTSDLVRRVWLHREGQVEGFTKRYGCKMLVWSERHDTIEAAIVREKQMKEWKRAWKLRVIEELNPGWDDLYETICQ